MAFSGSFLTTAEGRARPRALSLLCFALVLHFVLLVAFRLIADRDEFTNWDLIGFLNANSFASLGDLLQQSEVHFRHPFSFPAYNTGAESVLAAVVHHAMSGTSLYWSNTVLLAIVDVVFVAALFLLLRLTFRDLEGQCLAWMFAAMSPVLLTFPSTSAFDTQAFATITAALAGTELMLQSRRAAGMLLLALAFLLISQAYPLTFFLPVFCGVWIGFRRLQAAAHARDPKLLVDRNAALAVAWIAALVLAVELLSSGAYLAKMASVLAEPIAKRKHKHHSHDILDKAGILLRHAFFPGETIPGRPGAPGFAPYFVLVALAVGLVLAAMAGPAWLVAFAWLALVVFGYSPSVVGNSPKSQRCFFGDLFLAMATATVWSRVLRERLLATRAAVVLLVLLCACADAFYVHEVMRVNHKREHDPVFDFDRADGTVRHDLDSAVDLMRKQLDIGRAGLIVYYPRGKTENTTDPAMFHAHFLRHFGAWRDRDDIIFPCHFCETRYGCPFPDSLAHPCHKGCCYTDPMKTIADTPRIALRKMWLWWFTDPDWPDEPRLTQVLGSLQRRYRIVDRGTPAMERRWHCYELLPNGRS